MTPKNEASLNSDQPSPKVTVVLPTYNRLGALKKCLNSLKDQSLQKGEYEIIIVDDGSTDGTSEFGKRLLDKKSENLFYYYQKNKGPASARNLGVCHAKGEIIAFLDDDCRAEKVWLEELIKGYEDQWVGGTGGRLISPLNETLADGYFAHVRIMEKPRMKKDRIEYVMTANASFRKAILSEIGGFDESFPFPGGEDPDLCSRIRERGWRFQYNPKAVVYHYHPRTLGTMRRTYFNYGIGKALFLLKNKKGLGSLMYEVASIGWFLLLALIKIPSYVWATRGWRGFVYSFFDIYIRIILRFGLVIGYFRYRNLY